MKGHFAVKRLLDATIPVAGNFPPKSVDWYTYVGADGSTAPGEGREIGPVRMSVLPDLIKATADSYFMVRGKGITGWPNGNPNALTIPDGFVVAFGFRAELSFGPRPWAWAEMSGGADVLIATSPTVIAGFGSIEGSFHLGPVSLGVSASLAVLDYDGQVSGTAEVCGRIHLLFVTIHRCATLHFGDPVPHTIPPPTGLPTDRVEQQADGSSILRPDVQIVDDGYRLVAWLPTDEGAAPTVWPDALIRIGCTWAPTVQIDPGQVGAGQFPGAALAPGGKPIGSLMLQYAWRMTKLVLSVFDPAANGWVPVAGQMAAAWQYGKSGDANGLAQAVELILLKPEKALWLEAVHDPTQLPSNPLDALATSCKVRGIAAEASWLLGGSAQDPAGACLLPPTTLSTDPKVSRLGGRVVFGVIGGSGLLSLAALRVAQPLLGVGLPQVVPAIVQFERAFTQALALPFVSSGDWRLQATLVLDEPIVDGGLYFLMLSGPVTQDKPLLSVSDEVGPWDFVAGALTPGSTSAQFRWSLPAKRSVRRITMSWSGAARLGLLGLRAITAPAQTAAAAQASGAAAQAQTNKNAIVPGDTNGADHRCLLLPNRRYKLDIDFQWQGTRYKQDDNNQRVLDGDVTGSTNPSAWNGNYAGGACARTYFFRTASEVTVPAVPVSQTDIAYVDAGLRQGLVRAQDHWEPRMLVRYLGGSEPAQGEVDRFWADPIRFHWTVGHAPRLAQAYGWALLAVVRRVDAGEDAATEVRPFTLLAPTNPAYLTAAARTRAAVAAAAPCPVPVEGGTMQTMPELVPQAWYEAHVRAAKAGVADVALPGATFRTSRWRDAPAMLAGLGFPSTGRGVAAGDLPVAAGKAAMLGSASGDGAFDDALRSLGYDSWSSAVVVPRVSLFWEPAGSGWALAGVLIESPEPIERGGRTANATLRPSLAPGQAEIFGAKRVDGSGSRLLFLATPAFVPAAWQDQPLRPVGPIVGGGGGRTPTGGGVVIDPNPIGPRRPPLRPVFNQPGLMLSLDDLRPTATGATTTVPLSGSMGLPTSPSFAGDLGS